MSQIAVQDQIKAIQQVTQQALKSKQAALKFLVDAGIVRDNNVQKVNDEGFSSKKKK